MLITHLKLKHWRNFKNLSIGIDKRTYIIGANAIGKSNLLDVFKFLRDICRPAGGGLQKAIADRGGISKLRCLEARTDNEIEISVTLKDDNDDIWEYTLAFAPEGKGTQRTLIKKERVQKNGDDVIAQRPDKDDSRDKARLTQTSLEQINSNANFRRIADFFIETTYLHLVPQLLKFPEIGGRIPEEDPFGQGLLHRIAKTPKKTRDARLKRIQQSLNAAVPQFNELRFEQDVTTGLPHLEASYKHWRKNGAWQREDQFSDGTLRLIGLLWMLQENNSLLLLEEPELSLNDAIVQYIPLMIDRVLRKQKAVNRQVIITTHSEALLRNPLNAAGILLLEATATGATGRVPTAEEKALLAAGLTPAEVLLPKTRPATIDQIGLF